MISILLNCTKGKTHKLILDFLEISDVLEQNSKMLESVNAISSIDKITSNISNSFWLKNSMTIKQGLVKELKKTYQNFDAYSIDNFEVNLQLEINKWVKNRTQGLINQIQIEETSDLKVIFLNAIYFKAEWLRHFEYVNDHFKFILLNGVEKNVNLIQNTFFSMDKIYYAKYNKFSVASIPYKNDQFVMDIYLPDLYNELGHMLSEIYKLNLGELVNNLTIAEKITIKMPKFEIDSESNINEYFNNLNFLSDLTTDLEPITGSNVEFKIDRIKHSAKICVTEKGTEAGAYTNAYGSLSEANWIHFIVNHPFMFMIREKQTNTIFFTGTVIEPDEFELDLDFWDEDDLDYFDEADVEKALNKRKYS